MTQQLTKLITNKRVLILGFGMEGRSTYNLLKEIGTYAALGIADQNPPGGNAAADVDTGGCKLHTGEGYLDCLDDFDIVIKSPGVALPQDISRYRCEITSQTEIFLQAYRQQVIGITGTKGKSTVSSLLCHVLSQNGIPCILAGNIGKPVFDIARDIAPETKIILELSCHQLEHCRVSPAVSVLLNLFEDHLDRYGTFDTYVNAKKNIYLHQKEQDILYCLAGIKPQERETAAHINVVSRDVLPQGLAEALNACGLRGTHSLDNSAFVYSIAKQHDISDRDFIAALRTYTPLRHRLEYIGTKNGIDYYDDSISTTVQSAISAIESIENTSTILLGGMDRGIDYTPLIEFISKSSLANVICMYEAGRRIYEMLSNHKDLKATVTYCNDLQEAVNTAQKKTPPGTACILSPAAASYGHFKNFEQRGDAYCSMLFDSATMS